MRKYDFDKMGGLWADQAREITERGVFVAHSGNWDLWSYSGTIYSIPVNESGCNASYWCALSCLRAHLFRLRQVRGYADLIPADWQDVNHDFLKSYGIA